MKSLRLVVLAAGGIFALPLHAWFPQWIDITARSHWRPNAIATGDFNEDGLPDTVATTTVPSIHVTLSQAGGTLAAPVDILPSGTSLGRGVFAADVTGDGNLDIVAGETGEPRLLVYPGNGDGTFGTVITSAIAMVPSGIAAADFNEDGKVDVAVRNTPASTLSIFTGDGAGQFAHAATSSIGAMSWELRTGDIDHDGFDDIAVGYRDTQPLQLFFGNGDGTFDPVLNVATTGSGMIRLLLADLDHDDDLELLYCFSTRNYMAVSVNSGSRTFSAGIEHAVREDPDDWFPGPNDMAAADADGDGHPDVVVATRYGIATLRGHGDGTLSSARVHRINNNSGDDILLFLAPAELTGDGRVDLLVGSAAKLWIVQNRTHDTVVTVTPEHPTISLGQTARLTVAVTSIGYHPPGSFPVPTGTVTLKLGDTVVGSGALVGGYFVVENDSLPVGNHTITAEYSGDDEYFQNAVEVLQRVVAEPTTTTVTLSPSATVEYGTRATALAAVGSPTPQPVSGRILLYLGDHLQAHLDAPEEGYTLNSLAPGTYQLRAEYEGSENHPPSESAPVTLTVMKAATTTTLSVITPRRFSAQSQNFFLQLSNADHSITTAQQLKLYEGSNLIATVNGAQGSATVALPVGVHYLHAVYEGDNKYKPSRSGFVRYEVIPDEGVNLSATPDGTTIRVRISSGLPGHPVYNYYYKLFRRIGNGPWEWFVAPGGTYDETNAQPNVVHAYRVEVYPTTSDQLLGTSNIDLAMVAGFTDDPLLPGTPVKAQHVSELLGATNALLEAAGISPVSLGGLAPGQPIRAQQLRTLRGAINQGRGSLGVASVSWANIIEPGRTIRALDLIELRDALR